VIFLFPGGDGTVTPDPARVAELEASARARDAELVGALIDDTRTAHTALVPVLTDMEEWLPTDGSHPSLDMAQASDVHTWRTEIGAAIDLYAESPGGSTAHNVAHAGFGSALGVLRLSVEAYSKAALTEDEDLRMDMLHLAMDLRTEAVRAWSVAATQLDQVGVDTGYGHVHLYLPADPGSGALAADGAGEGEGAASPGGHDDH
jgi:hypothetical protein